MQPYRLGRKRYECRLETAQPQAPTVSHLPLMPTTLPADGHGFALDPFTAKFMKEAFADPGRESETLLKLRPKLPGVNGAADLLIATTLKTGAVRSKMEFGEGDGPRLLSTQRLLAR